MPYFVGEVGNDLCQIVQLGQHRGTLGLVQYCCRILLERSVQNVCILCLEENQKPRWCAGQVFLDCIVDVIPLSVAVKILDASLFDLQIGHTPVLPYEPLHGLLALRRTLVVLAQKELRPSQKCTGR